MYCWSSDGVCWLWSMCVCVCAYSCKAQRNLNSAFAIIMGLNTAAVSRLNQTWEVSVRLSCLCLSNSYFITNTFGQCFPLRNVRGSSRSFSQNWSSSRWDSNAEQWKSALTADDWCLSLTGGVFLNGRTRLWTTKPTEKPSRGWNLQRSPSCLFFWKVRSTTLTVADAPSFFLPTHWIWWQIQSFFADITFIHEGNKTFHDNLVNFEKLVSSVLVVQKPELLILLF